MILLKFQTCLTHIIVSLQNITKVYIKSVHKSWNINLQNDINFGRTSIICLITDFRSTKKFGLILTFKIVLIFTHQNSGNGYRKFLIYSIIEPASELQAHNYFRFDIGQSNSGLGQKAEGIPRLERFFKYHRVTRFRFKIMFSIWTFLSGIFDCWIIKWSKMWSNDFDSFRVAISKEIILHIGLL